MMALFHKTVSELVNLTSELRKTGRKFSKIEESLHKLFSGDDYLCYLQKEVVTLINSLNEAERAADEIQAKVRERIVDDVPPVQVKIENDLEDFEDRNFEEVNDPSFSVCEGNEYTSEFSEIIKIKSEDSNSANGYMEMEIKQSIPTLPTTSNEIYTCRPSLSRGQSRARKKSSKTKLPKVDADTLDENSESDDNEVNYWEVEDSSEAQDKDNENDKDDESSQFSTETQKRKVRKPGTITPIPCPNCKELITNKRTIRNHLKNRCHVETEKKRRQTEMTRERLRHRWTHCSTCDKDVVTKIFPVHQKICLGSKGPPFECSGCKKVLLTRSELFVHVKMHSGQRDFNCTMCDYSAIRKSTLKCHMRTHSDEKKYQCNVCSMSFKSHSALTCHTTNRHENNPPSHQCPQCGKMFKRFYHLTNHIAIVHEKRRPYGCDKCDRRFQTTSHRRYHQKTHDNPTPDKRKKNCITETESSVCSGTEIN